MRNRIYTSVIIIVSIIHICNGIEIKRKLKRPSPTHFTQGLFFLNSKRLVESTGGYGGKSRIQLLDISKGNVEIIEGKGQTLRKRTFGEGCTQFDDIIYQLTWKSGKVLVYNLQLEFLYSFPLSGDSANYGGLREGWGITTDDTYIYITDGTQYIYKIDPEDWEIVNKYSVTKNGKPVMWLNELEYVRGYLYANVYGSNQILKLTRKGIVKEVYDLTQLFNINKGAYPSTVKFDPNEDVMNGIAYHKESGNFYITGKNWNYIFEVKLN